MGVFKWPAAHGRLASRRRCTARGVVRGRLPALGLGLFLVVAMTPLAMAAEVTQRLAELVDAGEYDKAYELAQENAAQRSGQPLFDFYYGVAAVETNKLSEGIFALERALIQRPGFDQARLELGRAYFMQGDDRRARREFEAVRAHDPPAEVAQKIERYLLAIQRRADEYETTVSGYVEAGGGYDSNVNSATSSDAVDTVVGRITLPNDNREQSDSFGHLQTQGRVSHPVSPGVNLLGEVGVRGRFHADEDEFDTAALDASFGALWRQADWRLRAMLDVGQFYLDDDEYRDRVGGRVGYQLDFSQRSTVGVNLNVSELSHDTQEFLDSTLWVLDAGITHTLDGPRPASVSLGAFVGGESADDDGTRAQANAERDIVGVRAGTQVRLAPEWGFRGSVEVRSSDYDEADLLFSESRDEEYYALDLALDWRPTAHWTIGPQIRVNSNNSNIDLYEYEREEFLIRARYDFY